MNSKYNNELDIIKRQRLKLILSYISKEIFKRDRGTRDIDLIRLGEKHGEDFSRSYLSLMLKGSRKISDKMIDRIIALVKKEDPEAPFDHDWFTTPLDDNHKLPIVTDLPYRKRRLSDTDGTITPQQEIEFIEAFSRVVRPMKLEPVLSMKEMILDELDEAHATALDKRPPVAKISIDTFTRDSDQLNNTFCFKSQIEFRDKCIEVGDHVIIERDYEEDPNKVFTVLYYIGGKHYFGLQEPKEQDDIPPFKDVPETQYCYRAWYGGSFHCIDDLEFEIVGKVTEVRKYF